MPYTPLHMGPGMIVKAMVPRHFSIIAFGITQVLVDLEVLWNMERHNTQLHTFFHTYLGASLIVLIAIPLGKTLSTFVPFNMEIVFNMLFIVGLLWFLVGEILRKRAQLRHLAKTQRK